MFQGKDHIVRRRAERVIGVMSYGGYDQIEKRQERGEERLDQFVYGGVTQERGEAKHMIGIE